MKPSARGITTSASIALRSDTTTAPAEPTAERICAEVVPWANRTTVRLNGFPAAVAEPENASAAANAARRRLGRFTVFFSSASGIGGFIALFWELRVRPRHPAVVERLVEGLLVYAGHAPDLAEATCRARRVLD